jgi:photosystem II stability/assembly factor-like uncharacterized protein
VGARGAVLRSDDTGATWTAVSAAAMRGGTRSIAVSGKIAVAVGESGSIARSTDGGATWTGAPLTGYDELTGVVSVTGGFCACGQAGSCWRSTDGGATWTQVLTSKHGLNALVTAGKTVVAVGDKGAIVRSTDSCQSFTDVTSGVAADLRGAWAGTKGMIAVGHDGALLRSTDGGASWSAVASGSKDELEGVWSDGKGLVVVVGTHAPRYSGPHRLKQAPPQAIVRRSTDGGKTWTEQTIQFMGAFAVAGAGKQVWMVGAQGAAMRSIDGGVTFTNVVVAFTRDLRAVTLDKQGKALVGGDQGAIFRQKK